PFESPAPFALAARALSPYVVRMGFSWAQMRDAVVDSFPKAPGLPKDKAGYLKTVDEIYVEDAYHSLSIEGHRGSRELIERVRTRAWNPDGDAADRQQKDAMAARGYYEAFQVVKASVGSVLDGENAGHVFDRDHSAWYRALFAPSVDAVRDLMPALSESLTEENDPGVRAVLGHFMFVYIHPYMDGNGRMGRFLLNVMLASGGYPWTVIPVGQ